MRLNHASIAAVVQETVAAVLGPEVGPDEPLMASGLDSLGAVELRNALQAQLPGAELPATLLFDYPSINALSGYIADQVRQANSSRRGHAQDSVVHCAEGCRTVIENAVGVQLANMNH